MKSWRFIASAAVLAACAVLGIILIPAHGEKKPFPAIQQTLNSYALADRALQRDLLMARAGLLRNYDPITADTLEIQSSLARLDHLRAQDPVFHTIAGRLEQDSADRAALVEQFKSDNALLQNSLARLALASATPRASRAASLLSTSVLRLTLDTTPDAVADAERGIHAYERSDAFAKSEDARQLYNHARLLIRLLPAMDQIVTNFQAIPIDQDLARVRATAATAQQQFERRQHQRKVILIVISAIAIASLIILGLGLHIHVQSLRRRGDFEHLHATILGLMIDVRSQDLPDRIRRALERLADHVGADRAYLLLGEGSTTAYNWPRRDTFTTLHTRAVIGAATSHKAWAEDHIWIPDLSALPFDQQQALARHGSMPASLILLRSPESEGAIVLGLERDKGPFHLRPETLAGLSAVLVAILQAIHRDRLEAERLEFERKLAQGRRMETIGTFASGIAHNVNNIIGAIAGFAETAELHVETGSAASRNLMEIGSAVNRARMLVDQVLSFGRSAERPRETVSLIPFIEETTRLLDASLPSDIALKLDSQIPSITLEADAVQLQQVLLNLCHNAAVAMPDGGRITCGFQRFRLRDPSRLSHATIPPANYVVISISDKGHGISSQIMPRLFDPFFTTRQAGTGLGLSTAWEIVEQHGGSIDVHSELHRGSRFSIWLPFAEIEHRGQPSPPYLGTGQTILLLNPDDKSLERDEDLVAALGYEPWGATTIDAALNVIEQSDLVLIASPDPSFSAMAHERLRPLLAKRRCLSASPMPLEGKDRLHYPLRPHELALVLANGQKNTGAAPSSRVTG